MGLYPRGLITGIKKTVAFFIYRNNIKTNNTNEIRGGIYPGGLIIGCIFCLQVDWRSAYNREGL